MLSTETIAALVAFRRERDWEQFHSPKNLAIALSVEAAELLECFQWTAEDSQRTVGAERLGQIKEEVGDLAILLTYLAHDLEIDLDDAARSKLTLNRARYPVERSKGSATKYNASRGEG